MIFKFWQLFEKLFKHSKMYHFQFASILVNVARCKLHSVKSIEEIR